MEEHKSMMALVAVSVNIMVEMEAFHEQAQEFALQMSIRDGQPKWAECHLNCIQIFRKKWMMGIPTALCLN